jgi:hypothetical protein
LTTKSNLGTTAGFRGRQRRADAKMGNFKKEKSRRVRDGKAEGGATFKIKG